MGSKQRLPCDERQPMMLASPRRPRCLLRAVVRPLSASGAANPNMIASFARRSPICRLRVVGSSLRSHCGGDANGVAIEGFAPDETLKAGELAERAAVGVDPRPSGGVVGRSLCARPRGNAYMVVWRGIPPDQTLTAGLGPSGRKKRPKEH